MIFGLGAATATGTAVPVTTPTTTGAAGVQTATPLTFSTGLQLWGTPSTALTVSQTLIENPSVAFAGAALPFAAGVLLPPLAVLGILIYAMSQGGKGSRR